MSLKALSIRHLQGNQQGNQVETCGFHGGNQKETVDIWRRFYSEADRLYRQHRPNAQQMEQHHKHRRNADILLDLELPEKAAVEFKMGLEALKPQAGAFHNGTT